MTSGSNAQKSISGVSEVDRKRSRPEAWIPIKDFDLSVFWRRKEKKFSKEQNLQDVDLSFLTFLITLYSNVGKEGKEGKM